MKSLRQDLPLQEMLNGIIKQASARLHAEGSGQEKVKAAMAGVTPPQAGQVKTAAAQGWTNPEYVEKLASSLEIIAANAHAIEPEQGGALGQIMAKLAAVEVPPAVNVKGSVLEATTGMNGKQQYTNNKPAGEDAAASEHDSAMEKARKTEGATQMQGNMNKAPGQQSGAVPHAEYPEKGPLVSLSKHANMRDFFIAALQGGAEKNANLAALADKAKGVAEKAKSGLQRYGELMKGGKHVEETASHAPGFGPHGRAGNVNPNKMHDLGNVAEHLKSNLARAGTAVGVAGAAHAMTGKSDKTKTAADLAREHILMKLAGEDVMKANITAPKDGGPLVGEGALSAHEAESVPKQPGDATSGAYGNANRKHLATNQAAIDMTKKDAKKDMVPQLAQVFDEPAFSPKHDNKLQENLRNTDKAGVKIAAAKAVLQKVAQAGCSCHGSGECSHCLIKQAAAKVNNSSTLSKTAMMGGDASGGMGGGVGGPGAGGGMTPMADGMGGVPDGCTCDHTGQCRVCKLKAALMEAMGAQGGAGGAPGAGGMPIGAEKPGEKNSNVGCY